LSFSIDGVHVDPIHADPLSDPEYYQSVNMMFDALEGTREVVDRPPKISSELNFLSSGAELLSS
jgi:hypothetical protein